MRNDLSLLYLSEQDTSTAGANNMLACVATMEETMRLLAAGDYVMGGPNRNSHGIKLHFYPQSAFPRMPLAGPDRRFMALIGYLGGDFHVCGMKWYGSNRANLELGLPRSILTLMLNDPETGLPLCIMSGSLISSMRTGAMAALGAKHLARTGASVLTQIGVGTIGHACCEAILSSCPQINELRIVSFSGKTAIDAANEFSSRFDIQAQAYSDISEAVRGADIISFANSGPAKPTLKREWLSPGSTVLASADFLMNPADLGTMTIAVDNWKMYEAYERDLQAFSPEERGSCGDLIDVLIREVKNNTISQEKIVHLGQVIAGKTHIDRREEPLLLVLDGMCVEDLAWGYKVFQNAQAKGIGLSLPLF